MAELPKDLQSQLAEFLQTASPLGKVMRDIASWQMSHDAQHRDLDTRLDQALASQNFRLQSLEAAAGKGWHGIARTAITAAAVLIAAAAGYAVRAAPAQAPPAVSSAR